MEDSKRQCTFSSSQIWRLMTNDKSGSGFGKEALKYIKQVNYEIELGRSISTQAHSRPTEWGKFIERRAFDLLGLEYQIVSRDRIFHPTIKYWSGMPDLLKDETVGDIKCPYTLESFCDKINALKDISVYKKEFPEDYWQLVSNGILTGAKYAEAVIYCPYKSELDAIREMASDFEGDQNKVAFIHFAADNELPYLIEGMKYKNLNIVRFEIPQADKYCLIDRVLKAVELLNIPKEDKRLNLTESI